MVDRRAAIELTGEIRTNWTGPVWYVSHLVALSPHSVTTPVKLVWNSSQIFKGVTMNDILLKGPHVLSPIRTVLLRRGVHAALGDNKEMYNSVWLKEGEMHLHGFLWRDRSEEDLKEFAITRVNVGDQTAGCIAQLPMRGAARLPIFIHLEVECRVLEEDSYVDDILMSHNSREELIKITRGVENMLKVGGFILKPWVLSGQNGRGNTAERIRQKQEVASQDKTIILPNQMRDEDSKALGVGCQMEEDKLYILTSVNFYKRKKKIHLTRSRCTSKLSPLTRRELLSQVAGL